MARLIAPLLDSIVSHRRAIDRLDPIELVGLPPAGALGRGFSRPCSRPLVPVAAVAAALRVWRKSDELLKLMSVNVNCIADG